jgi:hypothetical protein
LHELYLYASDDIKFVSKLNEESQKKAKKELNELNDTDRILAVQYFRQWVLQQKWLKTPTGKIAFSYHIF